MKQIPTTWVVMGWKKWPWQWLTYQCTLERTCGMITPRTNRTVTAPIDLQLFVTLHNATYISYFIGVPNATIPNNNYPLGLQFSNFNCILLYAFGLRVRQLLEVITANFKITLLFCVKQSISKANSIEKITP